MKPPRDDASMPAMRLDKWLWASRFFKTRGLARKAVDGGKVHLNGRRAKPSRAVRVGDRLRIQRADGEYTVDVLGLCEQRRPAAEARALYAETADSLAARELAASERRLQSYHAPHPERRPNKRDRRRIMAVTHGRKTD